MIKPINVSTKLPDGREVSIETGKLAKQADGSVVLTMGKTMILASAVSKKDAMDNVDFLPLSVDYQEKFASAGKIPGGFLKREGRLSDHEVLICRLVDRVLRPLFPSDYHADTQILLYLISADKDVLQGNIPVTVCSQQGEKNEAFDTRTFTGSDQIQLSVPVGDVHALGICRATGCRIDDGIDTVKGVIQAGWLKQITAGELTTPLLKKRRFARRSNHATHLMSGVEGLAGDLATQGARTTHHQNLHGVS